MRAEEKVLETLEKIDKKLGNIERYSESRTRYSNEYSALKTKWEKKKLVWRNLSRIENDISESIKSEIGYLVFPGILTFSILTIIIIIAIIIEKSFYSSSDKIWLKRMLETELMYRKEFGEKVIKGPYRPYRSVIDTIIYMLLISFGCFVLAVPSLFIMDDPAIKMEDLPFSEILFYLSYIIAISSIAIFLEYRKLKKDFEEVKEELKKEWGRYAEDL